MNLMRLPLAATCQPIRRAVGLVTGVLVLALGQGCYRGESPSWDLASTYIYAPASRLVRPESRIGPNSSLQSGGQTLPITLEAKGSSVVLDFGKEVGGLVSFDVLAGSGTDLAVGMAFSESFLFTGPVSDASNGGSGPDGALIALVVPGTTFTVPSKMLRGGFRFLTFFLASDGWVTLGDPRLAYSFSPAMLVPNQYPNYFLCDDDLVNRIWYAGAYTVQACLIDPGQGRVWPATAIGWDNSAWIGKGTSILVDGAKRDRTVWPGDMGISGATAFVSLGDTEAFGNSMTVLYEGQTAEGEFPYAGPQVNAYGSDTYHLWALYGTSQYYFYTGDRVWLNASWMGYQAGLAYILRRVGDAGLLEVTAKADWGRTGQGGLNIAANVLLFQVLNQAANLATVQGDAAFAGACAAQALMLKGRINALLWDDAAGAYLDSPGSQIHPQDGNALAVWFGAFDSADKPVRICQYLSANWNELGAQTPEWNGDIATFPGSMEVMAHFAVGDDVQALALIRREWGYMLDSPWGTGSTFWEGFHADGTFGYAPGGYMSLAHGWASGPTSALTGYVLGLAADSAGGAAYHVIPHLGDLMHVEGRLVFGRNDAVSVTCDRSGQNLVSLVVDATRHAGSLGVIGVPRFGQNLALTVNGRMVWDGASFLAVPGILGGSQDQDFIYLHGVEPGLWTVSSLPRVFTAVGSESQVSGTS